MAHHDLKILPPYFEAVASGKKTFEIRQDDRGFQAGDAVTLKEYTPPSGLSDGRLTGRNITFRIGYVTAFEQQLGWVVFSLIPYA